VAADIADGNAAALQRAALRFDGDAGKRRAAAVGDFAGDRAGGLRDRTAGEEDEEKESPERHGLPPDFGPRQCSGWFGSMSSERRNDAFAARSSPRQSCAVPREAKARASPGASSAARAKSFSAMAQSLRLSASLPRRSSERLRFHFVAAWFGSTR